MGLTAELFWSKIIFHNQFLRGLIIKSILPFMYFFGFFFKVSKQKIRQSFIEVNNRLLKSKFHTFAAKELLILLPHCLQNCKCPYRLTFNIGNCQSCGLCNIGELCRLAENYGVHISIATGGSIARRIVKEKKPKCLIAVACEQDLSSGIQDVFPIPVYGILNLRPFGPCIDTDLNLKDVEEAVKLLLKPE